jgi:hypothetical protein
VAADKYQFESLKQECEKYLISILLRNTAIDYYHLAIEVSAFKLMEASSKILEIKQSRFRFARYKVWSRPSPWTQNRCSMGACAFQARNKLELLIHFLKDHRRDANVFSTSVALRALSSHHGMGSPGIS